MHVHIATLGGSKEPVTKAINAIPGIDKIYLLYSRRFREVADEVSALCETLKMEVFIKEVNSFDFQNIVDSITQVYENEHRHGVTFSINITGGTNLMAAAACSCAFFIGATIYYVHWKEGEPMSEQLEVIPTPHTPNLDKIRDKTREILLFIADRTRDGKPIPSGTIIDEFRIDKQNLGYHLKKLESEKLITSERGFFDGVKIDRRQNSIMISGQGRLISSWLREN